MTSRVGARLAALLLSAAVLLPAAAQARTASFDDGAGDAKALNLGLAFGELFGGTPAEGPMFLDAPDEASADVVRTTIDHAEKRLTLTLQFRDLADTEGHSVDFRIFTPTGRFTLTAAKYGDRTSADLYAGSGNVVVISDGGASASDKPCRTVRARYDVATETMTASVPTACLGVPAWVQVGAAASRIKVTPQADGSANIASYADDAFRGGLSVRSVGRSPKVRRG